MDELAVDIDAVDLLDIADRLPGLAVDQDEIGALALLDRAAVTCESQCERAVRRARQQRGLRRQSGRNEQLHFLARRDPVLCTADAGLGPDRQCDTSDTRRALCRDRRGTDA